MAIHNSLQSSYRLLSCFTGRFLSTVGRESTQLGGVAARWRSSFGITSAEAFNFEREGKGSIKSRHLRLVVHAEEDRVENPDKPIEASRVLQLRLRPLVLLWLLQAGIELLRRGTLY